MLDMIFLITAIAGGTIMLVQFALTLMGMDDGPDVDADIDLDLGGGDAGSHLFDVLSFRTIVGAATFFGLAGKAALSAEMSEPAALVLALLAGVAALYGIYWAMRQVYRLQSSGNEDIRNALGKRAHVTVAVPPARSGAGKVQIRMQHRIIEYRAVTDDAERIRSGTEVVVLDCIGSDTLQISRLVSEPTEPEPVLAPEAV